MPRPVTTDAINAIFRAENRERAFSLEDEAEELNRWFVIRNLQDVESARGLLALMTP
jgi:hypothetical protein